MPLGFYQHSLPLPFSYSRLFYFYVGINSCCTRCAVAQLISRWRFCVNIAREERISGIDVTSPDHVRVWSLLTVELT